MNRKLGVKITQKIKKELAQNVNVNNIESTLFLLLPQITNKKSKK
jgi:hypothetical protein